MDRSIHRDVRRNSFSSLEINVAPLVIQMTRRFSQMLMAFLFPNKSQGQNDLSQQNNQRLNKPTGKHSNSTALKRRTRSAEVSIVRIFEENRIDR